MGHTVRMAKAGAAPRRRTPSGRKLAETVARRIEEDIIALDWPIGKVLGSEAELLERYQVSRAVLREAVRIVEHHLVATMRRGPGGGLVITAPDVSVVVRAVTLQLAFQSIRPQDLHEARTALEFMCIRLAAGRLTNEGIVRLQRYSELEGTPEAEDFHILVAELTGNPAMVLFQRVLGRLAEEHLRPVPKTSGGARELHQGHKRIADAIIARDPDRAEQLLRRHFDAIGRQWLREERSAMANKKRKAAAARART